MRAYSSVESLCCLTSAGVIGGSPGNGAGGGEGGGDEAGADIAQ